MSQQEGDG